jgi:hypothetical protein
MASVFVVGISYSVFRLYMSCRNAPGLELYYAFCIRGPHFISVFRETHIMYLIQPCLNSEEQLLVGRGGVCYWYIVKYIMYLCRLWLDRSTGT